MEHGHVNDDALGELIRIAGKRSRPAADDSRRIRAAARAAWQAHVHRRRQRRRIVWAAVASVAAVALLAVFVGSQRVTSAPAAAVVRLAGTVEIRRRDAAEWLTLDGGTVAAGDRVRTAAGGGAAFTLDGVSLRVAGGTVLRFESARRLGLDAGRVYIDTAAGAPTPIAIATPHGIVTDVGTRFEVRTSDASLRVRVRDGRIAIDTPEGRTLDGVAGEEVDVSSAGTVRRAAISAAGTEWSWAEALAAVPELEGRSAYDVLRWAAREMGRELRFGDAGAELRARAQILSGGDRSPNLSPAEVVEIVIATSAGLDYALEDDVLLIRSR